eukprot:TRINITY_DN14539_c0_g1_i1.p1 TRINITY_DN14539_c0_g1~~TRINITY_DN14539_c0_g1_i1.p1  ORF type:complete len:187 (-),score=28.24 TRINITY_DN14539_c0_g1_i1:177-737(-)
MSTLLTSPAPIPFSISVKLKHPIQRNLLPPTKIPKKAFKSTGAIPKPMFRGSFLTSPNSEALSRRRRDALLRQKNLFSNVSIQNKLKIKVALPEVNTFPKYTFKDYVFGKYSNTLKKCGVNKENRSIMLAAKQRKLNLLLGSRKFIPNIGKVSETINCSKLNRTLQLDTYNLLSNTQSKLILYPLH